MIRETQSGPPSISAPFAPGGPSSKRGRPGPAKYRKLGSGPLWRGPGSSRNARFSPPMLFAIFADLLNHLTNRIRHVDTRSSISNLERFVLGRTDRVPLCLRSRSEHRPRAMFHSVVRSQDGGRCLPKEARRKRSQRRKRGTRRTSGTCERREKK